MDQSKNILAEAPWRGLYAITDSLLMPGEQLLVKTEAALRGGCRILQYRHKTTTADNRSAHKIDMAQRLRQLCRLYRARLIINDDVELALAIEADGVHIGQGDSALRDVRRQLGRERLVGVSCHNSLALAQQAQAEGASYVAFGRFFVSHTKPQAPAAELEILHRAKQQLQIPVVAIGGITRDNAPAAISRGADLVAVIHDLFAVDDPDEIERRARCYTQLFSEH